MKKIYSGKVFDIEEWNVSINKKDLKRDIVISKDSVAILPVTEDGEIILIKQYRAPLKKEILEIPAGGIEKGELPETAAKRELMEEIGFYPKYLKPMASFYTTPGFCTEKMHLFLAKDLLHKKLENDEDEDITVIKLTLEEVLNMIKNKEIEDNKTLIAILMYSNMI